jgi:predicted Zn finger-like uncharacterized protein
MLIVCPSCATSYQIGDNSIGSAGRPVRCSRCRNIWHALPPGEAVPAPAAHVPSDVIATDAAVAAFKAELAGMGPPVLPQPETAILDDVGPEDSPSGLAPETAPLGDPDPVSFDAPTPEFTTAEAPNEDLSALLPQESEPTTVSWEAPVAVAAEPLPPMMLDGSTKSEPEDIESIAARRARRELGRHRALTVGRLAAVIMVLVATVAALINWRTEVVRHAPQMASLYAVLGLPVNLRGLTFQDVKTSTDTHDGVAVLVIEGMIANTLRVPVEVPRLRFGMRNENGTEIYTWTAMPTQNVIPPGDTIAFRSRLASPPSEGRTVSVRFFNKRDAVAGLR